jgi:DNA-binding transcriptional regulator LsrR (DeoR family)
MPRDFYAGPAELILTASVARRFFLDGKSKIEIADEFGVSRFKVARLIETARTSGLVRIEIGYPGLIDVELSGRLQRAFGLRHAVVIDTLDDDAASLRRNLGEAAAELLSEIVTSDDVLGLAWARSVRAMTTAVTRLATIPVVQLTGALSRPDMEDSGVDLVRRAARISGGPAYFFYAPMIVPDAATARALRQQPEVARAFGRFGSVNKAFVGIGRWAPQESTLYDASAEKERRLLRRLGVFAEIAGVLVDAEGQPVAMELTDRMIGINAAQMKAIPEVIGIAYGVAKAPAVRAGIGSGLINGLVTHTTLAAALLAADDNLCSAAGRPMKRRGGA